jgi:hypothetical protein
MEKKIKNVVVKFKVQNGEYEYVVTSVLKTKAENIHFVALRFVSQYYSNFSWRDKETWFFNCGEVATKLISYDVVDDATFNILDKYLY